MDPARERKLAGPTGVEMVGQIAELTRDVLVRSFKRIDTRQARVVLQVLSRANRSVPDWDVLRPVGTVTSGMLVFFCSPLLERVNDAISAIKKDGTMAALHKKWLGADAAADSSVNKVLPIPQAQ